MAGPPPATVAVARADLAGAVNRPPRTLRLAALLRANGYREQWRMPVAGAMTVGWYQESTGGLVALGTRSVAVPGDPAVTVRLTRAGRRLLRAGRRLPLSVRGTLSPNGRPVLHATGHPITVR
jgi:hypothetical protein